MAGKKKTTQKKAKATKKKRTIGRRVPFPASTFEEALQLGDAIQEHGAGQTIRRLTLFEALGKSPESGPSRMMVTNSSRYGITTGGYQAEFLELTPAGRVATSPEATPREKLEARFTLAIEGVEPFNHLYQHGKNKRIPSPQAMRDRLAETGVGEEHRRECVDVFLENAKFLGLLRTIAGAERLVSIEQVLDEVGEGAPSTELPLKGDNIAPTGKRNWDKTCFVIAPIGDDESEERKHSNMVLKALIGRALEEEDYEVIRADKITDPGMISGQVIEFLLKSSLVIADLSFHNPNVFYELAIRHVAGLPTVHLIRKGDAIPFDVKGFRTIVIDTDDKYDLVAKLDTYRAEIGNHVRMAKASGEGTNPIHVFAPGLEVKLSRG